MNARTANRILAVAAVVALVAVPVAAAAKGGNGQGKKPKKPHAVTYVFKGTYAGDSNVEVKHGNRHTKRAEFVGQTVAFDLAGARIVVADVNGDGSSDLTDVQVGDKVVVKSRMPRKQPAAQPLPARKLIDQTNHPADDEESSEPTG